MRLHRLVLFLFIILAVPARAGTPQVLATIKPVHSLVAAVMAGVGTPALLIAGAASGHSYVLKPSDARKIASAKVDLLDRTRPRNLSRGVAPKSRARCAAGRT